MMNTRDSNKKQRGSSLVEFAMCAPVLLMTAGSTIDLSRYMRYLQVTSFVSQEAANLIYRECSDITVLQPPKRGDTTLKVDETGTETAINSCISRITNSAQLRLDTTLAGAVVSSILVRYDVSMGEPRHIDGTGNTDPCDAPSKSLTFKETPFDDSFKQERASRWQTEVDQPLPIYLEEETEEDDNQNENVTNLDQTKRLKSSVRKKEVSASSSLWKKGLEFSDGVLSIKNLREVTAPARLTIDKKAICRARSVVAVQVNYAFIPIVKFIPQLPFVREEDEGIHRETTIL